MKRNKIFLIAGLALLVAIADLPYGYYQLLRFFIFGVGVYGAYLCIQENKITWMWIFGVITILFNPFFKVHFDKVIWQMIDLLVAIIQFTFFFVGMKQKEQK